ncbi:hypothetical protein TNCV_1080601 [Trichonephila clavipes]|nr:hypothetical protein TNCV_1080601 [Trichonephila clavipes]
MTGTRLVLGYRDLEDKETDYAHLKQAFVRTLILRGIDRKELEGKREVKQTSMLTRADRRGNSIDLRVKVLRIILEIRWSRRRQSLRSMRGMGNDRPRCAENPAGYGTLELLRVSSLRMTPVNLLRIDFMKGVQINFRFRSEIADLSMSNQIKQLQKMEKPVEIDPSDTKLGEG